MILYVTPKGGGETMTCHSHAEVNDAMTLLHDLHGYTEFSVVRGDVVCDFCSTHGVVRIYRTKPNQMMLRQISNDADITHMDADGLWGACADCAAILTRIRANDLLAVLGLRDRAVNLFMDSDPGVPRMLVEMSVAQAHSFFLHNWDGEAGDRVYTDSEIMGENHES